MFLEGAQFFSFSRKKQGGSPKFPYALKTPIWGVLKLVHTPLLVGMKKWFIRKAISLGDPILSPEEPGGARRRFLNPKQLEVNGERGDTLSCSVTLESKGTLFGVQTIFSGAASQKKVGKRIGATEELSIHWEASGKDAAATSAKDSPPYLAMGQNPNRTSSEHPIQSPLK